MYFAGRAWTVKYAKLLICIDYRGASGRKWISLEAAFIDYEPRGSGFDSCQPHQKNKKWINSLGASAPRLFFFVPTEGWFWSDLVYVFSPSPIGSQAGRTGDVKLEVKYLL